MKRRVQLSRRAATELRRIVDWYEAQESGQGERWSARFLKALQRLESKPRRFSLAREAETLAVELREFLYGSGRRKTLRVVFRVDGRIVSIVAVRHFAQRDLTADDLGTVD